jgi:hypothetical protein
MTELQGFVPFSNSNAITESVGAIWTRGKAVDKGVRT